MKTTMRDAAVNWSPTKIQAIPRAKERPGGQAAAERAIAVEERNAARARPDADQE